MHQLVKKKKVQTSLSSQDPGLSHSFPALTCQHLNAHGRSRLAPAAFPFGPLTIPEAALDSAL